MNQSHCLTMTPLRTLATPRSLTSSSKAHGSFTHVMKHVVRHLYLWQILIMKNFEPNEPANHQHHPHLHLCPSPQVGCISMMRLSGGVLLLRSKHSMSEQ